MDTLSEILKKRSPPGVLIFDLNDRLLYSNQEAYVILAARSGKETEAWSVPDEIFQLCRQLKGVYDTQPDAMQEKASHYPILSVGSGLPYALRALLLGDHGGQGNPTHIMVLLERIIERHEVDINKARQEFQLSKREGEVVMHICQGLGNREIAETLFISEYTVKDHIKNIMRKMKAGSRNEIVALLK
ncbi:MAG: LuxR C-terminal-related transcriptional regulator [Desulfuromonadaceae bacterium]|nr:LuxR C-terminal-related transcriptional regulator [Desulfuromonadaceae bacterium]